MWSSWKCQIKAILYPVLNGWGWSISLCARFNYVLLDTQASIHLFCKFPELNPWINFCNWCLLQWPACLRALQCSREEMECNFAAWATQPPVATESPWLAWTSSSMMSQGCGSHANISSCTFCPPVKVCSSVSLDYRSCLADRQQPGKRIWNHNFSEQIPVAFVSGCCAFSIIRIKSEKIKHHGISI